MQKKLKGISKILLLIIILVLIVVSSIVFGYSKDIRENMGEKTKEIINDAGEIVTDKVIEEGQEVIGKKLKETGEKMLEE